MEEKEALTNWLKKHKKKLILGGVSISVILSAIIGIKKRDELIKIWNLFMKFLDETSQRITDTTISTNLEDMPVLKTTDSNIPEIGSDSINVCSHIRNLHEGWAPSEEKIMSAVQMGYELKPNQTWVEAYTKKIAA